MERTVIHLNIADFAVAVERTLTARLRGRPVIIAPNGGARAAVYDMSDEAYQAGVRKGMALHQALRRLPEAVVLPPHPDRYEGAMQAIIRESLALSPRIEPGEIDGHLFLDLTGTSRLLGPPVDVAWRLQRRIRARLDLDPIWSVAPNKLVAKVATRLVKPTGEYVVGGGEEAAVLAPLPLHLIPGVEREEIRCLRELNLTRVHEVTALGRSRLAIPLGKRADTLFDMLCGVDDSPVAGLGERPPRLLRSHEFAADTNDARRLQAALYHLVEQAGHALRRRRLAAGRLAVAVDYSDGRRCTRQAAVRPAAAGEFVLYPVALQALNLAWTRRTRVRHIRITCDRLQFPPAQQPLFADERQTLSRRETLVNTIDAVRARFGWRALAVGRTLALDHTPTPLTEAFDDITYRNEADPLQAGQPLVEHL